MMTAEKTVSRARDEAPGGAENHHGDDQRHFNHRHGDGEKNGAERLADFQRDDLGVMHGGENGGEQGKRKRWGSPPRLSGTTGRHI